MVFHQLSQFPGVRAHLVINALGYLVDKDGSVLSSRKHCFVVVADLHGVNLPAVGVHYVAFSARLDVWLGSVNEQLSIICA